MTLSRCGLKDRQTHLNVSLAENSLPMYISLKSEKSTQSSQTVFVNVKILLQNKYLCIYEDTFGAKVLRDDFILKKLFFIALFFSMFRPL